MKSIFALVMLPLLSSLALAGDIQDPDHLLDQVTSYLGRPSFDADFKCGDKGRIVGAGKVLAIKMQSIEIAQEVVCKDEGKFLNTIVTPTGGALQGQEFAQSFFDNIKSSEVELDQSSYEADPKESLFAVMDYFGDSGTSISIKSVKFDKVSGPNSEKIEALVVSASVSTDAEGVPAMLRTVDVKLFINKSFPAISRVFKVEFSSGKVLVMKSLSGYLKVDSIQRK